MIEVDVRYYIFCFLCVITHIIPGKVLFSVNFVNYFVSSHQEIKRVFRFNDNVNQVLLRVGYLSDLRKYLHPQIQLTTQDQELIIIQ